MGMLVTTANDIDAGVWGNGNVVEKVGTVTIASSERDMVKAWKTDSASRRGRRIRYGVLQFEFGGRASSQTPIEGRQKCPDVVVSGYWD